MLKKLVIAVGVCLLGVSSALLPAAPTKDFGQAVMKNRQKAERRALKQRQRYEITALKDKHIPKGVRQQRKHAIQRERRALLDRQKTERQEAKDRDRIAKDGMARD